MAEPEVREAERNNIYDEYVGRIGELVNGQIKRFEAAGRIIVDLGKVEAILPRQQQSRSDAFGQGDRARTSATYREILDAMWLFNSKFEKALARFDEIKAQRKD